MDINKLFEASYDGRRKVNTRVGEIYINGVSILHELVKVDRCYGGKVMDFSECYGIYNVGQTPQEFYDRVWTTWKMLEPATERDLMIYGKQELDKRKGVEQHAREKEDTNRKNVEQMGITADELATLMNYYNENGTDEDSIRATQLVLQAQARKEEYKLQTEFSKKDTPDERMAKIRKQNDEWIEKDMKEWKKEKANYITKWEASHVSVRGLDKPRKLSRKKKKESSSLDF